MSEDYEEEEIEAPPEEEIISFCREHGPCEESYAYLKYGNLVLREGILNYWKDMMNISKTESRKDYERYMKTNVDDPFWLKIYNKVNAKYGKKIVAMDDSRQLMLKRGNIYTPDINKFTLYLSKVCNDYKTGYRTVRNDVLEKFRDSHLFDRNDFCYDPFLINFKNGYYNVKNNRFIKSEDSKKIFFYEIPHEYKNDKDYRCPNFMDALKKWLGINNKVSPKDMFQFMGYTMSMNVGQRKSFLIKGETKSGKTQFQEILKALVGRENTSEISLQMLGDDKFSSSSLEWKILNYFDDLPQKGLTDVSLFKIIAGGSSTIPIRRMHTEPYSCVNTVCLWYNTNNVPMTKATEDDSFFNRWIITFFPNKFEEESPDPDYEDIPYFHKTITEDKDEMQGIIHYCLKALRILYKNKHFRKVLSTDSRKIWEYESDLLYAFLDKYTVLDDDEDIHCGEFRHWYNIYRRTRHPSRRRPGVTPTALNKEMDIRGYERRQQSRGSKSRIYKGLKFNKRFDIEKDNDFKEKAYKTREEYIKEHPDSLNGTNGEPEVEGEDMGEFHFTDGDYNHKERLERKASRLIKKRKV